VPLSGVAYGLHVRAPWPLPELGRSSASGTVVVRRSQRTIPPSDGSICLDWPTVGRFVVQRGEEIVVTPACGVSRAALRLYLLGPVFAALLHQRGLFLLHASAVAIGGRAIAVLGDAGAGKSTAAAALVERGHGFLADDVVALTPSSDGDFAVLPAFPQLKLWPDAAGAVGLDRDLPRVCPTADKRAVRVRMRFVARPQPFVRAYVLESGGPPGTTPMRGASAHFALLRHSYGRRILQANRAGAHFAECAEVARRVPVRKLRATRCLATVSDLVRAVEDDLA